MNSVPSLYRKFALAAGMFIALALAVQILLPLVINTSAIRTRILSQVADRFPGEVDFRTIRPALFPWPQVVVTQGRFSQSDKFTIRFSRGIVYPKLWPLFFGRLKIGRLKVVKPDVVVFLPAQSSSSQEKPGDQTLRGLGRQIGGTLIAAARKLGLSAAWVEDGRLVLNRTGQAGIAFSQVNVESKIAGEQLALEISGRSNLSKEFQLEVRIDLSSLDCTGKLNISGLDTKRLATFELVPTAVPVPVMVMDLEMNFLTQGLETFRSDLQVKAPDVVVKNGPRQLTVRELFLKGEAQWTKRQAKFTLSHLQTGTPGLQLHGSATWSLIDRPEIIPTELLLTGIDLDVAQIGTDARQLAGDQPVVRRIFDIVRGGRIPELTVSIKKPNGDPERIAARFGLQGRLTDGRIIVPHDLLHLEAVNGQVMIEKGRLSAENVSARLGNSVSQNGTLQLGLLDGTQAFILDADIDTDLSELRPILKKLALNQKSADWLDRIPSITGRTRGRLRLGNSLERITARIAVSGHIDVLDAALNVSGTVDGLPSAETSIQLDLNGSVGPRAVAWLGRWGAIPAELYPKAPITVTRTQITRTPAGVVGLNGNFFIAAGPHITTAFKINQEGLEVNNFHLKDATSDAVIAFKRSRDRSNWKVGFKGYLDKSTTDKFLQQNNVIQGWLKGDLKVDFQADSPARAEIHGRLESRQITIPLGSRPPLSILNASLQGNGSRFDLSSAEFKWQESTARLSGSGTFAPEALDLDLTLTADTLDADKMMPDIKSEQSADSVQSSKQKHAIPLRGKVRVEVGRLIFGGYHFAPLQAIVILQAGQTTVDLSVADLCGIAMPGQIRFDQDGLWLAVKPHATRSALRDTDQCLSGTPITERFEGTLSASGRIETHGRSDEELTRNLVGQLDLEISDGRVFNVGAAGFFTNLLSFISVNQLIEGSLPDLRKNDFRYKNLTSKLVLKDGMLRIEEGVLKSNAVNIVGNGDYELASKKLDMILLVSPLTTVDWIIERIPLIGNILQGTLVAIPVGVKGPVVNPTVVPLSPAAVGSRLGGILERTIKTPFRILSPLLKDNPKSGP